MPATPTPHTIFSYQGYDIDIGPKNAGPLVLLLGTTPTLDDVKVFVQELYGDCKIVPSPQERKALHSSLEHAEPEFIQGDLKFVEKPKWPGLTFPQLRELNKTESEKKIDEIVESESHSEKYKNEYMKDLIKKAEMALNSLNVAKKSHQALMLKNELDTFRTVAREYGEGSRARVQQQIVLENRLNGLTL
ncbi:hypothetical protein C9374_000536 [Naegleria lovaniensis]|uniref:Uncharacterized protein n=1 Tax=Naegleria lovaniensis TaxID=51637 RepID=A0AA88GT33_NAELO|nr:uncharacterized protein C9374_000536 [Naegleria lovaniensis]KAG2388372.1 hypothetical protein C9374_000536 [Naegleria lovaniensis]